MQDGKWHTLIIKKKNDNTHKSEAQEIRWTNEVTNIIVTLYISQSYPFCVDGRTHERTDPNNRNASYRKTTLLSSESHLVFICSIKDLLKI